jgi:hypothetical protein
MRPTLAFQVFAAAAAFVQAACTNDVRPAAPGPPPFLDDASVFATEPSLAPAITNTGPGPVVDAEAAPAVAPASATDAAVDAGVVVVVGLADDASADAAPEGACDAALSPGQLVIDELMIDAVSGSGDDGEWLEVSNRADCSVNMRNLHAECARGTTVVTLDVSEDVWISPGADFLVADSTTPAINHYLPGLVFGWYGHPSDVLRNMGATVTLMSNGVVIDSVTYPALSLTVGASIAFPSDCDAAARIDWTRWQTSVGSFFPGFLGTPNAPNTDVHCP